MLRAASASKPTAVYTLAQSAVAVSCPSDTNEDTLATITIPGGTMGPNGRIRVTTLWSVTNSANNKTLRIRLGGGAGAQYMAITLTASAAYVASLEIVNRGSAASQVGAPNAHGSGFSGASGAAVQTSTVDMTVDQTIVITGQKALNTETITLEGYSVEMMP